VREAQPEFLDARLRQAAGWAGNAGGADQRSADSDRCRNARYTVERLVAILSTMRSLRATCIASGPIRDIVGTTHGSPVIRATTDRELTGIGRC